MSNVYGEVGLETASESKAVYLLTEILRKVAGFPESVEVLQNVEDGKTVLQVYAARTDIRAIHAGNGRMAQSLEAIARALSKHDGRPIRLRFLEQPEA